MPSPVPVGPQANPLPRLQPNPLRGFLKMIDWRLVAAVALPLWAFLLGVVVTRKPAPAPPAAEPAESVAVTPPAPEPPPQQPAPPAPPPAPPEVVVRTELQPLPVVIPVPMASEPVSAPVAEFKLPASEVMPADRCKTFDTKLRFHPDLTTAAEEARLSRKMLLVLHISGNFDDPGFT